MSAADEVRAKGRSLHSLARKLSEHLGGRGDEEWVESELHGLMKDLRGKLEELEQELDVPWATTPGADAPAAGVPAAGVPAAGAPAADTPAPDTSEAEAPKVEDRKMYGGVGDLVEELRRRPPLEATRYALSGRGRPTLLEDLGRGVASFGHDAGAALTEAKEGDQGPTLEEFFGRVGDSLIAAQQQLDERSRKEIAATFDDPGARQLATLYRIPKVQAELKFALQKVGKKGLNLLIFNQGTQASTLNQQSVQFEIAAVPAPPETLERLAVMAPRLDWVLEPAPRRELFERLAVAEPSSGANTAERDQLAGRGGRLLIVRRPDEEDAYLLADADPEGGSVAGSMAGIWSLELEGETARLRSVCRLDGAGAAPARELIARLAAGQAELLDGE